MHMSIGDWLRTLGKKFVPYIANFEENGVDYSLFEELNHEMLIEIGIEKIVHRAVILKAAAKHCKGTGNQDSEMIVCPHCAYSNIKAFIANGKPCYFCSKPIPFMEEEGHVTGGAPPSSPAEDSEDWKRLDSPPKTSESFQRPSQQNSIEGSSSHHSSLQKSSHPSSQIRSSAEGVNDQQTAGADPKTILPSRPRSSASKDLEPTPTSSLEKEKPNAPQYTEKFDINKVESPNQKEAVEKGFENLPGHTRDIRSGPPPPTKKPLKNNNEQLNNSKRDVSNIIPNKENNTGSSGLNHKAKTFVPRVNQPSSSPTLHSHHYHSSQSNSIPKISPQNMITDPKKFFSAKKKRKRPSPDLSPPHIPSKSPEKEQKFNNPFRRQERETPRFDTNSYPAVSEEPKEQSNKFSVPPLPRKDRFKPPPRPPRNGRPDRLRDSSQSDTPPDYRNRPDPPRKHNSGRYSTPQNPPEQSRDRNYYEPKQRQRSPKREWREPSNDYPRKRSSPEHTPSTSSKHKQAEKLQYHSSGYSRYDDKPLRDSNRTQRSDRSSQRKSEYTSDSSSEESQRSSGRRHPDAFRGGPPTQLKPGVIKPKRYRNKPSPPVRNYSNRQSFNSYREPDFKPPDPSSSSSDSSYRQRPRRPPITDKRDPPRQSYPSPPRKRRAHSPRRTESSDDSVDKYMSQLGRVKRGYDRGRNKRGRGKPKRRVDQPIRRDNQPIRRDDQSIRRDDQPLRRRKRGRGGPRNHGERKPAPPTRPYSPDKPKGRGRGRPGRGFPAAKPPRGYQY